MLICIHIALCTYYAEMQMCACYGWKTNPITLRARRLTKRNGEFARQPPHSVCECSCTMDVCVGMPMNFGLSCFALISKLKPKFRYEAQTGGATHPICTARAVHSEASMKLSRHDVWLLLLLLFLFTFKYYGSSPGRTRRFTVEPEY